MLSRRNETNRSLVGEMRVGEMSLNQNEMTTFQRFGIVGFHSRYNIIHDTFIVMVFSQVGERTSGRDVDEELLDGLGYTEFFLTCVSSLKQEEIIVRSPRGWRIGVDAGCNWNTGM